MFFAAINDEVETMFSKLVTVTGTGDVTQFERDWAAIREDLEASNIPEEELLPQICQRMYQKGWQITAVPLGNCAQVEA